MMLKYNTTFGNIISLIFFFFLIIKASDVKKILIRNCQVLWVFRVLEHTALGARSDSNSDLPSKLLADQVKTEGPASSG